MSKENITRIKVVYDALEELANEVVFIGGATVACLKINTSASGYLCILTKTNKEGYE